MSGAVVDDDFVETINALPRLQYLHLVDPVFALEYSATPRKALPLVTISGGTVDPASLTMLGSFECSLRLIGCTLNLPVDEPFEMRETKAIWIERCSLTDDLLLRFVDLPNLKWFTTRSDAVTKAARDTFRETRPDVSIE